MTKLLQLILESNLGPAYETVRGAAFGTVGAGLEGVVSHYAGRIRREYLRRRIPEGTEASARRLNGYEEELAEMERFLRTCLTERYTKWRKEHDVALIQRPMLEHRLREGLAGKGVPFLFQTKGQFNILTLRVVGTHFMEIKVDPGNVDRVVLLAPYLIRYPHRAKEEFPCCVTLGSYPDLARKWNEVSVGGKGTE